MKGKETPVDQSLQAVAAVISRFRKQRFLAGLSEDEFRDRALRPLFLRLGLKDGRDLCGPSEQGKDAVFFQSSPLGGEDLIVVQTKKGNLTLAGKARDNVVNAIAQIRTAAMTSVVAQLSRQKMIPSKVLLCASGTINDSAKRHIADEVHDPRLAFLDSDDLVPLIDEHMPELWLDLDAKVIPYMRGVRRAIEEASDNVAVAELVPAAGAAATDGMFVDLLLWRTVLKPRKMRGKIERVPDLIELPVTGILGKPEKRVLILGEAGAGKSTAIRRLAYVLAGRALSAESEFAIPVLLRAVDVAKRGGEGVLSLAVAETRRISGAIESAFSHEDLARGRVILLVDGLDEVASDLERAGVLDAIEAFLSSYPGCRIVLTSRDYAFLKRLPALAMYCAYRVEQISIRQAQQLIQKLERKGRLPVESSKELIRRLEDVHGMELNPLLVTVFAATSEGGRQDIPANITELFKKFTEMMLGRWDANKGFSLQYQAPLKDFILTKIAFEMHRTRVTDLSLGEFQSRVAQHLQDMGYSADLEQLLDEIQNRSGLLRTVGDRVEFRHLLLQEFFAGRGIPSEDLLMDFVFDEWWRRAVVFYFGERPNNSPGLVRFRSVLPGRSATERFIGAGTLGLSVQASYLLPISEKQHGITAVIENFASIRDEVIDGNSESPRFPLSGFLAYYLNGRDSVALAALSQLVPGIRAMWATATGLDTSEREARDFWLIVGLLESGRVAEAEELAAGFRPADPRYLLGIHLGCFVIQHLRVTGHDQVRCAKRICERIADKVAVLRRQVVDEFRTQILELRRGEIAAIPEEMEER